MSRLAVERDFHDAQAAARRRTLTLADLVVDDDAYLDHESWIRPAMDRLGDVAGKRVLDLGSGHGMASIVLARRGARVTGLELSRGYLAEARDRARINGVDVDWIAADGNALPFADRVFHFAWGNAVLHHLDLARAADEIFRVLVPGGRAIFCEPWDENPLLRWVRRRRSAGTCHTPDERPLRGADLATLRRRFPALQCEGHQLASMVSRARRGFGTKFLRRFDRACLKLVPGLWQWCRYVVIELKK